MNDLGPVDSPAPWKHRQPQKPVTEKTVVTPGSQPFNVAISVDRKKFRGQQ